MTGRSTDDYDRRVEAKEAATPDEMRIVPSTRLERFHDRRRDRKQRRAWRRERRKGIGNLERAVEEAGKRGWQRTDFLDNHD